ncbi:MAG: glycosyltransferase family 2 protein [Thermoanaerobaculales bacterium]|jgi:glycosyltransferase involved in cell wall biosynthesis|nr:glycosyltransferase family 2 protein [Thermoanaerobaculales bacterium]
MGELDRVFIVLPAYNAARTLEWTVNEIPPAYRGNLVLVDDASTDDTVGVARRLGLSVIRHEHNRGYGGNQKTCYRAALEAGAEIVIMLHPDHQYDARLIPDLVEPLQRAEADAAFGSRMLGGRPMEGGMPRWKYNANIFLTALANAVFGRYLTEIHSGFRAYTATYLNTIRFEDNRDDFVFDTEIIAQGMVAGLFFKEVPIETRYFPEASSITFGRGVAYGFGVLSVLLRYLLHTHGILKDQRLMPRTVSGRQR